MIDCTKFQKAEGPMLKNLGVNFQFQKFRRTNFLKYCVEHFNIFKIYKDQFVKLKNIRNNLKKKKGRTNV